MFTKEDDINNKIMLCKNILNNTYEILELLKPLIPLLLKMEEAKTYREDGTFEKVASLFGEISDLCKEIEYSSPPVNINFENLGN
ncbi:MAG: hypothetical protein ACFFCV_10675 [Promethearchaeota archaeon]